MGEQTAPILLLTMVLIFSMVGVGTAGGQDGSTLYVVETSDGEQICLSPIEGTENVSAFYGQETTENDSRSGETGLEEPETASLFLYRDTTSGNLSLVFLHGSPNESNLRRADYNLSGFAGLSWIVKDDPGSFPYDSYETDNGSLTAVNWRWQSGFDGGAVGPLGDRFNLSVDATTQEVNTWRLLNGDRSVAWTIPVGGSVRVRTPPPGSGLCGSSGAEEPADSENETTDSSDSTDDDPPTLPLIALVLVGIGVGVYYFRRRM